MHRHAMLCYAIPCFAVGLQVTLLIYTLTVNPYPMPEHLTLTKGQVQPDRSDPKITYTKKRIPPNPEAHQRYAQFHVSTNHQAL